MRALHRDTGTKVPAAVMASVLLLRIAALLLIGDPGSDSWEGRISYTDTNSYLHAAADIEDGTQDQPLFRTPGYPVLLLATRDLAGPRWNATMLLQQIADLLTALIVVAASRPILGRSRATWAGVYYLLLPSGIIYSSYLIPDVIVSMFIAFSGLLWLRTGPGTGIHRALLHGILGGLCFAAALLLKPVVLYAPSIYFALAFIPSRPGRVARTVFASTLAAVCLTAYLLLRAHNMAAFGMPGMTTQDAFEPMGRTVQMADYHGVGVGGEKFWLFRDSLETISSVDGSIDYGVRDSIFRAVTIDALRSNPMRVAYFEFTRWPKFFVNLDAHRPYLGTTPTDRKPLLYAGLSTIVQMPLGLALLAAILSRSVRRRLDRLFWLGLAWFIYSVPVIGPIASFRYGLMFYWLLVPILFVSVEELARRHRDAMPAAQRSGKNVSP